MVKIYTCSQELSSNFHTAATHTHTSNTPHPPTHTQKGATASSKSSQTWVLTGSCAILLLTRTQMLGGKLSSCSQLVSKRQNLQPQKTTLLFFTSNPKEPFCTQHAENIFIFKSWGTCKSIPLPRTQTLCLKSDVHSCGRIANKPQVCSCWSPILFSFHVEKPAASFFNRKQHCGQLHTELWQRFCVVPSTSLIFPTETFISEAQIWINISWWRATPIPKAVLFHCLKIIKSTVVGILLCGSTPSSFSGFSSLLSVTIHIPPPRPQISHNARQLNVMRVILQWSGQLYAGLPRSTVSYVVHHGQTGSM